MHPVCSRINGYIKHQKMVEVKPENCASYSRIKDGMEDGSVVIIDVRNPDEVAASGRIESKRWLNVPYADSIFEQAMQLSDEEFEKKYGGKKPAEDGSDMILNCGSGNRSSRSVTVALGLGYPKVRHYAGGLRQWKTDIGKN